MAETAMSHAMVVNKGTGTVYLADPEVIDADTAWVEVFKTLKDTLSITQSAPDKTDVFVDQLTTPIASTLGTGAFDIAFTIPDCAPEVLAYMFDTTAATFAPAGKTGLNVSSSLKVVNKMFRVDFDNESSFIATNVDLNGVFEKSADGTFNINVTGTVLAAKGAGFETSEVVFWKKS